MRIVLEQQQTNVIEEVVEKCKGRLKDLYLKRRSKIQFGSSTESIADLDSLFVNLKLLHGGKISFEGEHKQPDSHLGLLNMKYVKDKKEYPCTHVLLRGYAGCGKSTLINKLTHDWAQSEEKQKTFSVYKRFNLVIALDVRRIKKGTSLENAIRKQLLPKISAEEISTILGHEHESCLCLIDGYDELSSESVEDMADILDHPLLSTCWVIMTTRPHMISLFNQHCKSYHEYVHVEVSGFSKESIEQYVKKFFQLQAHGVTTTNLSASFLRRIQTVPILDSLSSHPILLLMLCHLWLDKQEQGEQDLPDNLTEIYKEAIEYLNKHWWKRFEKDKERVLLEL